MLLQIPVEHDIHDEWAKRDDCSDDSVDDHTTRERHDRLAG